MLLPTSRKAIVLALCLVTRVHAQNITASSCASPNGFTQCYEPLVPLYSACLARSDGSPDAIVICDCAFHLGELNCAMTNCWNVVYGCEYQSLANFYAAYCANPIPFFPAPDNAPGGCSCNLGYVYYNATNTVDQFKDCATSDIDGCNCCFQAAGYAALYDICPTTSIDFTEGPDASDLLDVLIPNLKAGRCAPIFSQYDCSSLGFTEPGVPFMTSFNAATLGTQSISNTNTETLSSPASGATFTWTDLSLTYTIVAASANARATSGGSAVRGTSGATQGTASASAKNDARQDQPSRTILTALMVAMTLVTLFT